MSPPIFPTDNALVICNTAPPAPGNSGDCDFSSAVHCYKPHSLWGQPAGKTMAVLPRSLSCFTVHCHVCLGISNPRHFPRTMGTKHKYKTRHICWAIPRSAQRLEASCYKWLVHNSTQDAIKLRQASQGHYFVSHSDILPYFHRNTMY